MYQKAIELTPNLAYTYYYLSWVYLAYEEDDKAIINIKKAISLDPLNEFFKIMQPIILSFSGENGEAEKICLEMLENAPGANTTLFTLGVVYSNMGEYEKALNTLLKRSVGHTTNFMVAYNYAKTGQKDKAREILEYLLQLPDDKAPPTVQYGLVYLGLEEYDNAITWFEKGQANKDQWLLWLKQSWCDPIKDDPRFVKILNTWEEILN